MFKKKKTKLYNKKKIKKAKIEELTKDLEMIR